MQRIRLHPVEFQRLLLLLPQSCHRAAQLTLALVRLLACLLALFRTVRLSVGGRGRSLYRLLFIMADLSACITKTPLLSILSLLILSLSLSLSLSVPPLLNAAFCSRHKNE